MFCKNGILKYNSPKAWNESIEKLNHKEYSIINFNNTLNQKLNYFGIICSTLLKIWYGEIQFQFAKKLLSVWWHKGDVNLAKLLNNGHGWWKPSEHGKSCLSECE